ncbi:MAG: hypothetical protein JSS49_13315 [Planctomycetes bacterium]|nr:hypothetical protein [Planctomycetota bacterium]
MDARFGFGLLVFISLASSVSAEVVRFEITRREPFAHVELFGDVGPYETIVGRVHYALDPQLRQNSGVVDLTLAPRNDAGKVEFWADLFILTPADPARGNGALLYDVNNRGNKLALGMFNYGGNNNPTTREHAGDGFLMRHGFTVVWSGWDGELLPGGDRLRLAAPVVRSGTEPITGKVRCEFIPTAGTKRMVVNWANHGSYRPTESGLRHATLTIRSRPQAPRVVVPRDEWTMHVTDISSDSPTQLPNVEVEIPGGMQAAAIYELIYEAADPLVMGVAFPAVRDLISALKHGTGDQNPLVRAGKPVIQRAHGFGVSQSGRFLREFLYAGFNEDEQGNRAFDGLIPHVAGGGLGSFNHRFAQPTRHSNQFDHHDYPPDRFPFAYETQSDPLSGQTDGILRRSVETNTTPLVMHTQSASEYWTRSGSLPHTDPLGTRDAKLPEQVRLYSFGGTQHGPAGWPVQKGSGQTFANPGDYKPFLRSLLLALDRWSRDGTVPPASVYPTIQDGTLVDWHQSRTGFPQIPGVNYPEIIQQPAYLDFGPRWQTERIIDLQPPQPRGDYKVLAPRCGTDGNELGCLLPVEVAVPVATYTGWNLRAAAAGAEGQLVSLTGSYIPFPKSREERERLGDPRLSVHERYGSLDGYLQQFHKACDTLKAGGYLQDEDARRLMDVHRDRVAALFESR